ncbi:putative porin [Psychrosphaera sp.]|nr:putative porin [Psychrosphaera sp.]
MRLPLVLILLTSTAASANEYQSITQLSHSNFDEVMSTDNSTAINSVYYFDKKRALGPLSEFEYINTTNNVFGSYFNNSDSNFAFGGQVFYDQWQVGGAYITNDSDHIDASQTEFTLGYLLTQNLLINVSHNRVDGDYKFIYSGGGTESFSDSQTYLGAQYTHALQGKDYIGVTVDVESGLDSISASTKYFSHLGDERYVAIGLRLSDFEDVKPVVGVEGTYYFNQQSSLFAQVIRNTEFDVTSTVIGGQHFVNQNWALSLSYMSNEVETYDGMATIVKNANALTFAITAQF